MSTTQYKVFLMLICTAVVVACNLLAWTSWSSTFVLNDGIQYQSTARNWLAGLGFSTDALMYVPHFQGSLPAPQTVWPMGYSVVIASISMLGMSLEAASLLLNLASITISALLVFLILMRFSLSFSAALLCAVIFFLTASPWAYSMALVTETFFSVLLLAAIYFQPSYKNQSYLPFVFSGILVALSIMVRYSGVFFAVGIGVCMLAFQIKHYPRDYERFWFGFKRLTVQLSLPVALFGLMTYRTQVLTGTVSRDIGVVDSGSLTIRLRQVYWQLGEFIGFTDEGITSAAANVPLFMAFLVLFFLVVAQVIYVRRKRMSTGGKQLGPEWDYMRYVIYGHTAVFIAFFTLSIAGFTFLELNHRYLYQIYPGLFILFCLWTAEAARAMKKLRFKRLNRLLNLTLSALVFLFLLAQVNLISAVKYYASPGLQARDVVALQVSEDVDLQSFIQACFVRSGVRSGAIWSNDGQQLYYATGVSTITVADVYGNHPYSMDIVRDHIATYDIKMFVILNDLPDIDPAYIKMLGDVKDLMVQRGYEKIEMLENRIVNDITVEVYVVDSACSSAA